jgi:hypothetical protein
VKEFTTLLDETQNVIDLQELEAAADLFHYGLENGHYTKKQATEFNILYWKVKNRMLAYDCVDSSKGSFLDVIAIVTNAPSDVKDDTKKLKSYVNSRLKAIKGR